MRRSVSAFAAPRGGASEGRLFFFGGTRPILRRSVVVTSSSLGRRSLIADVAPSGRRLCHATQQRSGHNNGPAASHTTTERHATRPYGRREKPSVHSQDLPKRLIALATEQQWEKVFKELEENAGDERLDLNLYLPILRQSVWQGKIEAMMRLLPEALALSQASGQPMEPRLFSFLVEGMIKSGADLMPLIRMVLRSDVRPNFGTYDRMLSWISRWGDVETAEELLHHMLKVDGFSVRLRTCNKMLELYCNRDKMDKAQGLLHTMKSNGLEPDAITLGILLKKANDPELFLAYVKKVLESFPPSSSTSNNQDSFSASGQLNLITFNMGINSCARGPTDSRPDIAQQLLCIMEEARMKPDVSTLTSLIKIYHQCQDWQSAFQLLQYLTEGGDGCSDSVVDKARVWRLFRGVKPDSPCYNTVLRCCLEADRAEESMQVIRQMQKENIQPVESTISQLVALYARQNDPKGAEWVINWAKNWGASSTTAYNIALSSCQTPSEADNMFKRMKDAGLQPDLVTYNTLINICAKSGSEDQATNYFEQLVQQRLTPGLDTFNSLLNVCATTKNSGLAFILWDKMRAMKVQPDNLTILALFGACGGPLDPDPSNLERAWTEATSLGIPLTIENFTCFISSCAKRKHLDTAVKAFSKMKAAGQTPNIRTYNALLNACAQVGSADKARKLYSSMLEAGLQPDAVTMATLINACVKGNQVDYAWQLLCSLPHHMRKVFTFGPFVARLLKLQDLPGVLSLLKEMQEKFFCYPDKKMLVSAKVLAEQLGNAEAARQLQQEIEANNQQGQQQQRHQPSSSSH
ncbi:hypothetical protein QOT17_020801 [Balamuthia mandrillaris]